MVSRRELPATISNITRGRFSSVAFVTLAADGGKTVAAEFKTDARSAAVETWRFVRTTRRHGDGCLHLRVRAPLPLPAAACCSASLLPLSPPSTTDSACVFGVLLLVLVLFSYGP